MTWTFDPLVRRNAWFNIDVLGAQVDEYLVDFYGPIDDAINAGDASDRLLVAWPTSGPLPARPTPRRAAAGRSPCRRPDDIVVLRRTDAGGASAWRLRFREELGGPLTDGGASSGSPATGEYLVLPRPES